MDHLGLFVVQNNYSKHAAQMKGNSLDRSKFDGLRTPIDEYCAALARGEAPMLVQQEMPQRLARLFASLVILMGHIAASCRVSSSMLQETFGIFWWPPLKKRFGKMKSCTVPVRCHSMARWR